MLTPTLTLPECGENIYEKKRNNHFAIHEKNKFSKMNFLLVFKSFSRVRVVTDDNFELTGLKGFMHLLHCTVTVICSTANIEMCDLSLI